MPHDDHLAERSRFTVGMVVALCALAILLLTIVAVVGAAAYQAMTLPAGVEMNEWLQTTSTALVGFLTGAFAKMMSDFVSG